MREKLLNRHNICEKEDLTSDQIQRLDGQKNGTIFEVFAFTRSQRVFKLGLQTRFKLLQINRGC